MLYLEISGRRSGKTDRLIAAAKEHQAEGKRAVVICRFSKEAERLANEHALETVQAGEFQRYVTARGELYARQHKTRYFFDDFDSYVSPVQIYPSGYYVTVPARVRDEYEQDFLMRLIKLAAVKDIPIHSYSNSSFGKEFQVTHDGCTTRDVIYQTQVLGRYLRSQLK